MSYCPQCGQATANSLFCFECSRERAPCESAASGVEMSAPGLSDDVGGDRVAIARFQNGAEAGYFADELTRAAGVEAEVLARERFDAVHAAWAVDYILLVDRPHAVQSALTLHALVEATGDDAGDEAADVSETSEIPGGVWVPLILTLAAGSIACFGIDRLEHRPRQGALVIRDRREPPELWEVLGARRGPWIQKLEGGPGVRELTLDPNNRSAKLKEDHDGDGRFDREWDFSWKKR